MVAVLALATQLTAAPPLSPWEQALMRLNPMLLTAACVFTGLLIINLRRGSAYFWGGPISRPDSPGLFWAAIVGNAILAVGAWFGGLGFSVR